MSLIIQRNLYSFYIFGYLKKMAIMEFIQKLAALLQSQQQVARWCEEGTQFQIFNVLEFQNYVLNKYFRHSKLESFIRQLNMYGFRKISRRKNQMIFHHEHFIRGKEDLYHLIKRKVKLDAPPKHELETNVQIKEQVECIRESEPNFAELMNKLLKFKEDIKKNQKNLKSVLDTISREVSMKKSRVIKPYITEIKECFKNIDQAGKRVDETLNKNCNLKEKKSIVSRRTPPKNIKFLSAPDMKGFEEECTTKKQKRFDDGILSLEEIGSFKSIGSYIN